MLRETEECFCSALQSLIQEFPKYVCFVQWEARYRSCCATETPLLAIYAKHPSWIRIFGLQVDSSLEGVDIRREAGNNCKREIYQWHTSILERIWQLKSLCYSTSVLDNKMEHRALWGLKLSKIPEKQKLALVFSISPCLTVPVFATSEWDIQKDQESSKWLVLEIFHINHLTRNT